MVFEEQLVARHNLCMWAARLLTDVSVLSHEHDTCTLLQMPPDGVPGLADVVQLLLTTYALLDKHLEVSPPCSCIGPCYAWNRHCGMHCEASPLRLAEQHWERICRMPFDKHSNNGSLHGGGRSCMCLQESGQGLQWLKIVHGRCTGAWRGASHNCLRLSGLGWRKCAPAHQAGT